MNIKKAMERDIPLKVREKILNVGKYGSVSYLCQICNWNVEPQDNFCKNCGQKLKWN